MTIPTFAASWPSLQEKPLTVDVAEDGHQAVELLREHSYSVILLDLLMPGMNGFGVLDFIDENAAHAPVVLVVSGAPRSVLDKLDSAKIHGVVRKPFIPQDIADIVAACTEIRTRGTFETMVWPR